MAEENKSVAAAAKKDVGSVSEMKSGKSANISYAAESKKTGQTYRAVQMMPRNANAGAGVSDLLAQASLKSSVKGGNQQGVSSLGNGGGYPQPSNVNMNQQSQAKANQELVLVVKDDEESSSKAKAPLEGVAEWDGFDALNCHRSSSQSPEQMMDACESILTQILDDQKHSEPIDFLKQKEQSKLSFQGRYFGMNDFCEWRISIFADSNNHNKSSASVSASKNSKNDDNNNNNNNSKDVNNNKNSSSSSSSSNNCCIVELSRVYGDNYLFSKIEFVILSRLLKQGAISQLYERLESGTDFGGFPAVLAGDDEDEDMLAAEDDIEDSDNRKNHITLMPEQASNKEKAAAAEEKEEASFLADTSASDDESDLFPMDLDFDFDLDGMESSAADDIKEADLDESKSAGGAIKKKTKKAAPAVNVELLIEDALALDSEPEIWKSDITDLSNAVGKHGEMFESKAPGLVKSLLLRISGADKKNEIFDCWVLRAYLDIVYKLLASAAADKSLNAADICKKVASVQEKWSKTVKSSFGFEFAPSQQISRSCDQIKKLFDDKQAK